MKHKYLRVFYIVFGIFLIAFLVVNFGLNFWLKSNLPKYVKNNSDYIITYKTLDVDAGTGDIFSTGITINNQNPDDTDRLGLQGTIDTLSISRLGIYEMLFNKRISTSDLTLVEPDLNIVLAKPTKEKENKKSNPLLFENIKITDGNIRVFKHTAQKVAAVKNLNLFIENFKLSKKSSTQSLPFVLDSYDVRGDDFYYRPDNVYAFSAKHIATTDGQLTVQKFAMKPLLSYQNFRRFYPKKRNLFDVSASEFKFKEIIFKNDDLSLDNVQFDNPIIKMYTTNVQPENKEKSFTYDVKLENLLLKNAKVDIRKPAGTPLFAAENLNMNISRLMMNDETAKGNIPFKYEDFTIKGSSINYVSNSEDISVANVNFAPKSAQLFNVKVRSTTVNTAKTNVNLAAGSLQFKINEWEFIDNKLKLDVQNIFVNQLNGSIKTARNPSAKKTSFENVQFPLKIKNISLKNSNLVVDSKDQPLVFKNLNANIEQLELNEQTIKNKIPFKTGNYSLTTKNFNYKTKFYNFSASLLKLNKSAVQLNNFAMKPLVSRSQFIRMIPAEKDLYDLKVNQITANGKWDLVSENKLIDFSNVTMNGMSAVIFRSKIPRDDVSVKPMYSQLLRSIKFPLFVQNLSVKNSELIYEEDTKKSDGPGKLTFNNFTMNVKNLNSGKMKGRPTLIPITIQCRFMNASPMRVNWSFDTASSNDAFSISGNIADLPASRINPFIEPYLKIQATGLISDLIFNFKGTARGIGGTLKMVHQDLRVGILKESGEKDKLLSAVANIFVKTDSGIYPESVVVEGVERDKTKSFFNLFWQGIEQGLKKTLIGKNAPKTEKSIKATVDNTKTALEQNKKDLDEKRAERKEKEMNRAEKVQPANNQNKRKGFLKGIFKKKSEN